MGSRGDYFWLELGKRFGIVTKKEWMRRRLAWMNCLRTEKRKKKPCTKNRVSGGRRHASPCASGAGIIYNSCGPVALLVLLFGARLFRISARKASWEEPPEPHRWHFIQFWGPRKMELHISFWQQDMTIYTKRSSGKMNEWQRAKKQKTGNLNEWAYWWVECVNRHVLLLLCGTKHRGVRNVEERKEKVWNGFKKLARCISESRYTSINCVYSTDLFLII